MRSTNAEVQRFVDAAAERSFLTTDGVADAVGGPRHAIHHALVREVAAGYLAPVRRGLFWKPTGKHRQPQGFEVAAEVVRLAGLADGAGPSGQAARWLLGLADLPALWIEAVPGRAPAALPGVRFVRRCREQRLGLTRYDVAALELLREGPLPSLPHPAVVDLRSVACAAVAERSLAVRERGRLLLPGEDFC